MFPASLFPRPVFPYLARASSVIPVTPPTFEEIIKAILLRLDRLELKVGR